MLSLEINNKILFSGYSPEELREVFRQMVREEIERALAAQDEQLLSPAETCKIFIPKLAIGTLSAWEKQGLIEKRQIGGRIGYLRSEVIAASKKQKKYKSIYNS